MYLLNYSKTGVDSHFPPTFRIIGSKRFLPLCCSRKCQSALAYSFIECYSSPWLLPRRPPLVASSHLFQRGLSQRLWIMTPKTKTMWHIISILRVVWTNNKFALLITVWKAKKLPSEVKCHCQSQRTSVLTSKATSPESCHSIYGNPDGTQNPHVRFSSAI